MSRAKNPTCLSKAQIAAVVNTNEGPGIKAPAGAVAPNYVDNTAVGYAYDGGFMTTVGIPARDIGQPTSPPGNFGAGTLSFPYAFISPPDPTYFILDFNFATDTGLLKTSTPVVSYSTSLDISKFINYGHKIIWYHGLSDPGPPVLGTIVYYDAMANCYGGLQASQSFSRLYPVPNMDHCSGGATTDQFDLLTPLTQWVESGTAPGPISATGVHFDAATYQVGFVSGPPANAPTTRSRPLCPYPQEARFTGSTTMVNVYRRHKSGRSCQCFELHLHHAVAPVSCSNPTPPILPIPEIDIWRAATLMLKRYGEKALDESAARADELAAQDDYNGAAVWRRITDAVGQLANTTPSGRSTDHLEFSFRSRIDPDPLILHNRLSQEYEGDSPSGGITPVPLGRL